MSPRGPIQPALPSAWAPVGLGGVRIGHSSSRHPYMGKPATVQPALWLQLSPALRLKLLLGSFSRPSVLCSPWAPQHSWV